MQPPIIAFQAGFFLQTPNAALEVVIASREWNYQYSNPFYQDDDSVLFDGLLTVGQIACEINPLEGIIDSSPITIEIAADASVFWRNTSFNLYRVRDAFAAKPSFVWTLAESCPTDATQMVVAGNHSSFEGVVCCGLESAWIGDGVYDGTNTTFDFWARYQGNTFGCYPHYVDPDLGYGPAVTDVPTVWKGRECAIFVNVPDAQISQNNNGMDPIRYRRCVYADAPQILGNKIVLSVVPIDSRIRDRQASAHLPGVAKLATRKNSNADGRKVRKTFAICQPDKRYFSATVTNGSTSFSLGSSTYPIYRMLYGTLQPASGMPPGRCAADIANPGTFNTAQNPRLDGADYSIGYRSGTTAYFNTAMPYDGFYTTATLPSFRWYVTTSTTDRPLVRLFAAANARASTPTTAANNEPFIGFTNYDGRLDVTAAQFYYRVGSNAGQFQFGLLYSRTYSGEDIPAEAQAIRARDNKNNWANLITQNTSVIPRCYSVVVDEGCNIDGVLANCDLYSVRPTSAADQYIERWLGYTSDQAGDVETLALWTVEPGTVKSAAFSQSANYYVAGEPYIWLDRQLAPQAVDRWYQAHWTEDGNSWHDRRLLLRYIQDDGADGHRYQVMATPRPRFAGIGDWCGYQAQLTVDPAVESTNDGTLIAGILLGADGADANNPSATGLNIPLYCVDKASFATECGHSALVSKYGFKDLNGLEDNLIALLLFSGTAISITTNYGYEGYAIRRVNMGAPSPDEVVAQINDDDLLTMPSAMLSGDILAEYIFHLPDDVTFTYVDAVAKNVLNAQKTLEFDFTHCEIADLPTRDAIANVIRGELATLVDRYGAEALEYTIQIPWEKGGLITPGDAITLTSAYGTGPASATPPNNVICRVLGVTQDLMAYTTTIKCRAFGGYSARYQTGAIVLSWDTANYYYFCDNVDGFAVGDVLVTDTGYTVTISAISTGSRRITVSGTFRKARYIRKQTYEPLRFMWGQSWMI